MRPFQFHNRQVNSISTLAGKPRHHVISGTVRWHVQFEQARFSHSGDINGQPYRNQGNGTKQQPEWGVSEIGYGMLQPGFISYSLRQACRYNK